MGEGRYAVRGPYRRWEKESASELGELLHQARRWAGLTQHQLAQKIGMNRSQLAQIETGRRQLLWADFEKIKAAIDPQEELLGRVKNERRLSDWNLIAVLPRAAKPSGQLKWG